jgi:hypothetical protein
LYCIPVVLSLNLSPILSTARSSFLTSGYKFGRPEDTTKAENNVQDLNGLLALLKRLPLLASYLPGMVYAAIRRIGAEPRRLSQRD